MIRTRACPFCEDGRVPQLVNYADYHYNGCEPICEYVACEECGGTGNYEEEPKEKTMKVGDKITFDVGEKLEYEVEKGEWGYFLLGPMVESCPTIFLRLGLDKKDFCRKVYGYLRPGVWPEAHTMEDLSRLVEALQERCSGTDYNKALIDFMFLKQAKIGPEYNYFNWEDAKVIESWSPGQAKRVWEEIVTSYKDEMYGLTIDCCPFCITFHKSYLGPGCEACPYAAKHGACGEEGSDWMSIPREIRKYFDWRPLFEKIALPKKAPPKLDLKDLATAKSIHKKMWEWIAENCREGFSAVDLKESAIEHLGLPKMMQNCALCEYTSTPAGELRCGRCPGKWANTICTISEYGTFKRALKAGQPEIASFIARQIANICE